MRVDISQEAIAFVAVVLCGLFCGLIRDFFEVLSKRTKNKVVAAVFDFLLVTVCIAAVISVFYRYNSFQMRWYMFLGIFLGVLMYFLILSKSVVLFLEKTLELFENIFKILLTPARFLYKILVVYFFVPVFKFFKKISGILRAKITRILEISRSKCYEKRKNKKTKKIKSYRRHFSRFGTFYADKGNNTSTADNR